MIPNGGGFVAPPNGISDECFFGVAAGMRRVSQRPDIRLGGSGSVGDERIGISATTARHIDDVRRFAVLIANIAENQQELSIVRNAEFRCNQIQMRCAFRFSGCVRCSGDVFAAGEVRLTRRGICQQ